jgi:hypothetical protein
MAGILVNLALIAIVIRFSKRLRTNHE